MPLMSSVRRPLLRTFAMTNGRPVAERFAVSERIVKFDRAEPPGPIETYIRTPTRLTSLTPPATEDGVETSAQMTA